MDLSTAKGMLINIAAGEDLTFYEVEAAASRVKAEIPLDASIIVGQCNNPELSGRLRVSVVATGLEQKSAQAAAQPAGYEVANQAMEQPATAVTAPTTPAPVMVLSPHQ